MKPIQTIRIVGAGAMGAAYAAMFTDAQGFSVAFIARGERFMRLKNQTFSVNGKLYPITVVHPDQGPEPADLILVALKHHHLAAAIKDITALSGPQTAILSVMNGLESETIIGKECGLDKLVNAVAVGIDAQHQNGRFSYANPGKIIFGPIGAGDGGPDLARIREALNRAGIDNEVPADIQRAMWWKFMINVGINQASAVLRAPYGVFQSSPDARALMHALMREVIALATRAGIDLTEKDLAKWDEVLSNVSPHGKTSMLQDVEASRKTEVEIFAGSVVAMGRTYGVPTPANALVQHIIKVVESRYGA